MEGGGWLWLLVDVLGVALLAGAIIYATMKWRNRPKDPTAKGLREAKTREIYKEGG